MLTRAAVLAAGILASGSASLGDEADRGHFTWRPAVDLSTVADDNVFLTSKGGDSDIGFWMTPRLELAYRTAAYQLGADLGADLRRYTRAKSANGEFLRMSAYGEVGLFPGLTVRLEDAYVPQPVRLGQPEDQTSNLVQSNRFEGEMRYWRELGEGREVAIGLRGTRFDSDSFPTLLPGGVADPDFRADFWDAGGFLELQDPLGPGRVFLHGGARYRAFDDPLASDHIEASALLGWRAQWLRRLDLEAAAGGGVLDQTGGSTTPSFLGRANLRYRSEGGWIVGLGLQHGFTADLAGNDFVDTTGRVALERWFGSRTAAKLTLFGSLLDAASQDPNRNLFGGVEFGVRHQITRRVQVGASYRFWENGGGFAADDFTQNRAMLSLSYRH